MTVEKLMKKLSELTEEMSKTGVPEDKEMRGALAVLYALCCALAGRRARACAEHVAEFTREELLEALRESGEIPLV